MNGYQFLLEVDALYQNTVVTTLRFCCQPGYTGGGYTWLPRIINPGLLKISLFSGGKTTGASSYSFGEIVLGNFKQFSDSVGPIDFIKDYNFYGRTVKMYYGPMNASFPSGFTQGFTAVVAGQSHNWETISLSLRGQQAELDVPVSTVKFAGTNALPNGREGTIDLRGKDKPVLLGRSFNFEPSQCNSAKLIYAVSPLTGISVDEFGSEFHVYDEGVELYYSGKVADIEAVQPPPGQYSASLDGYIRLGSTPAGQVTCSGCSKGDSLTSHPANLVTKVLTLLGKSSLINTASFTAYATKDKAERGLVATGKNASTVIDEILAPLGYWYYNATGNLVLGFLEDPSTLTPVYTLTTLPASVNIASFACRKAADTKDGIPASSVTMTYQKNYTIQAQPAGSVSTDRRQKIALPYSTNAANSILPIHPLSSPFSIDTALSNSNPTFANKVRDLYTDDRELVDVSITQNHFLETVGLLPGNCVALDLQGRFGYSGKHMIIVGATIDYAKELTQLTLWG